MDRMSRRLNQIWNWIRRYKYLFVTGVFVLVIGVLDENSFLNRYDTKRQIREMKQEIRFYTEMYEQDTERLMDLNRNPETVTRIARERYLMKNEDEDVFVVTKSDNEETE